MTITYAEITIIRNVNQETVFETMSRYFGYEPYVSSKDDIILLFDDTTICNTKECSSNRKFIFTNHNEHIKSVPHTILFTNSKKSNCDINITLTYKKSHLDSLGQAYLNFNPIFKNSVKYNHANKTASSFNCIYVDPAKVQKLAIVKLKSNEEKPRFMVAYDDALFEKVDIMYLVDSMFKNLCGCV